MLLNMRGNKRPLTLPAHHQVIGCQLVDGFTNRALAHAVTARQVHFRWNRLAWLPLSRLQALQYKRLDLAVKRAESGCGQSRVISR